jgi:hypothetical protein
MLKMSNFILDLENKILAAAMKPIHRSELTCISNLVFYTGIRVGEIGQLNICDVIDESGGVRDVVEKFERQLPLNREAKNAVSKYYAEMKQKHPFQALRRNQLFPTLQNQKTLNRHWKKVETQYAKIQKAGRKHHFESNQSDSRSLGRIYKNGAEQFRITARQYQAVILNKRIPPGRDNDRQCTDALLELLEKADFLKAGTPTAKLEAEEILRKAQEFVNRIKDVELRDNWKKGISYLPAQLSKHLQS